MIDSLNSNLITSNPGPYTARRAANDHDLTERELRTREIALQNVSFAAFTSQQRWVYNLDHALTLPEPKQSLPEEAIEQAPDDTSPHLTYLLTILNYPDYFNAINTMRGFLNAMREALRETNCSNAYFILERYEDLLPDLEAECQALRLEHYLTFKEIQRQFLGCQPRDWVPTQIN